MEETLPVECPHCDFEQDEHVEFNLDSADQTGVNSDLREATCDECGKMFWFKARCDFDFEITDWFKKKPKVKEK